MLVLVFSLLLSLSLSLPLALQLDSRKHGDNEKWKALSNVDKNLVIFIFLMLILAIAHIFICFVVGGGGGGVVSLAISWRHSAIDAITNHLERCARWLFGFLLAFHLEIYENRMENQRADNQIAVKIIYRIRCGCMLDGYRRALLMQMVIGCR